MGHYILIFSTPVIMTAVTTMALSCKEATSFSNIFSKGRETSLFWSKLKLKSKSARVVRGMLNFFGDQIIVVRTFNDPKLADNLFAMLAAQDASGALAHMKLCNKIDYNPLPKIHLLPIPECEELPAAVQIADAHDTFGQNW